MVTGMGWREAEDGLWVPHSTELGSGASKWGPWSTFGPVCGVWLENMGTPEHRVLLCDANRGKKSRSVGVTHNHQDCPCRAAFLLDSPRFSSLLRSPWPALPFRVYSYLQSDLWKEKHKLLCPLLQIPKTKLFVFFPQWKFSVTWAEVATNSGFAQLSCLRSREPHLKHPPAGKMQFPQGAGGVVLSAWCLLKHRTLRLPLHTEAGKETSFICL